MVMQHILLLIVIILNFSGDFMYFFRKLSLIIATFTLVVITPDCAKNSSQPKESTDKELVAGTSDKTTPAAKTESHVKAISGLDELNSIVNNTPGRLLVLDLYADWCMPCKVLAPLFDTLANVHHDKADFYRIDVDKNKDIAMTFSVQSIPLVLFIKDKQVVTSFPGLNPRENYEKAIAEFSVIAPAAASTPATPQPRVSIKTTKGEIVVELDSSKAPLTVNNFLAYVKSGFYSGTIFHRVIPNFMIQGGGHTPDMNRKNPQPPVKNEADNRLSNRRGTIAMARTSDPQSANSQFFINVVDNVNLDYREPTMAGWGYCVFGKVVSGMDVADAIAASPTGPMDIPTTPILIEKVTLLDSVAVQ